MIELANEARLGWTSAGHPFSMRFDDKYFCEEDGLQEAEHIFCRGNSLSLRWAALPHEGRRIFTLAEIGFGSGLNFLCAWRLWDQALARGWRLRYIGIERFPLTAGELSKVLAAWPVLDPYARRFLNRYPKRVEGRVDCFYWPEDGLELILLWRDVTEALSAKVAGVWFPDPVDAWFLDGFAPAKNPEMWSGRVFQAMATLSRKGTTLATFTAAGRVRRGLIDAGFEVHRDKGFGRKRHMLRGEMR